MEGAGKDGCSGCAGEIALRTHRSKAAYSRRDKPGLPHYPSINQQLARQKLPVPRPPRATCRRVGRVAALAPSLVRRPYLKKRTQYRRPACRPGHSPRWLRNSIHGRITECRGAAAMPSQVHDPRVFAPMGGHMADPVERLAYLLENLRYEPKFLLSHHQHHADPQIECAAVI